MIRDPREHHVFLLHIGWIAICACASECRHVKNVCITPSLSPETHLNNSEGSCLPYGVSYVLDNHISKWHLQTDSFLKT